MEKALSEWWGWFRELQRARHAVKLAEYRARAKIAGHAVRADIEWDMKWAHEDQRHSLRDEFLIALWALPTILLFIPATRPSIEAGFKVLKDFSPDAPMAYVVGWGVILTTVFGMKQIVGLFLPAKYARLAEALGSLRPDIPTETAEKAEPDGPSEPKSKD